MSGTGRDPVVQDKVLELMDEHGCVNAAGVAEATGFSRGVVKQAIFRMSKRGEIVPHPATKGAWMRAPKEQDHDHQ